MNENKLCKGYMMKIIKSSYWLFAIIVLTGLSCGKSNRLADSSAAHTATGNLPVMMQAEGRRLVPMPVDAVQPWEKVDTRGFVVKAHNRTISGLYQDSEFQSGVDRHLDDGISKENGEAIRLASGASGEKKIAWAMWRLTMGGIQPGVITLDANLGSADAKYFVAISDYKRNCWLWLGEFDTPNAIIPMKSGEYLSKLGNAFVVVLSYNGASVDVVGAGAHPVTADDNTPPAEVVNPKAAAVPGGLLLIWDKVADADLAGYQISIDNKSINSLTNLNYSLITYSSGKVTIASRDTSNNASNPVEITIPESLVPGKIAEVYFSTDITGTQCNGKANLKATCNLPEAKYDFDLNGDGVFESQNNTTGATNTIYKDTGILRPAVRVKDSSGVVHAFSAVSLIVSSNSRPFVDMTVDKSYGQIPLEVKYTAEFQDYDGTVDQLWWDANGDGTYEAPIASPKSPATTTYPLTTIGITNARVRVADNDGATDVASVAVQINSASVIKLEDDYEPDGEYFPQLIKPTGFQQQDHNIYPACDEDWFSFWAISGLEYTISSNSITDFDVVVYLYNQFGLCLYIDDNSSGGKQFKLEWKPITTGNYYIKVIAKNSTSTGKYTINFNLNQQGIWYQRGQDRTHKGRSPFTGPKTNALKWMYPRGGNSNSSPVIGADGTIYYAHDSNGVYGYGLYAMNSDGSVKWSYATDDNIFSTPAIGTDGTIYVGCYDKKLYAFNPDGSIKWSFTTNGNVSSSPAIGIDGTIYVGSYDKKLYAINSNGTLKWYFSTSREVTSSPAIGIDSTIYIGSEDGKLYAINPDGTLKWSYSTTDVVHSSPAIGDDGTIYVGSYDKKLYAINPDGSLKWSYATGGWVRSSPAIGADGTIFVGSKDKNLYAINPDGSLKWSYVTENWVYSSPAIGTDGTIYVGCYIGRLYAIGPGEGY